MQNADFIIIGSGSAGSALAYRLSEDGKNSVMVLEYGGSDVGPFIQMPAALAWPMSMKRYNWGYLSEPEPNLNNRRITAPRGKVIGGSSSINGMVYVRGSAEDFDGWEESGAKGWGYADVLPYFKRMENSHGGQDGWRGTDGPLHVQRGPAKNPLVRAFVEAGKQAGFETTEDYNGEKQEGFGLMEQTIWRSRRWSAANAYLKPAMKRGNVELVRCFARKIVIENGCAAGVEIERNGKIEVVKANREVIVSASTFNSPKLLMLSGIGPAQHLKDMGIEVKVDRPGVGANLMDHMEFYFQQVATKPVSLYSWLPWFWQGVAGAQWLFSGTGLGSSNQF
ncbi:MAG: GMC family oxidoreductase N-terminal domain-containing protein, partial [Allorhizobium sp.]